MTQIENVLKVYWREMPSPYEISVADDAAAVRHISAYLSALPPTGDVAELVKEAREQYFAEPDRSFVDRLAHALTAAEARIAELERENFALAAITCEAPVLDERGNRQCERIIAANARAERLEAALREYADRLQKGADHVVHYSLMETPRKLPNIATVVEISAGHLRDIAKDMLDAATA